MKKSILFGAAMAAMGLAIAPVNAQTQTSATTTSTETGSGYIQSSKIIGSKIRSSDGSEVGVIKDVVLDRQSGCMAYTVLETTGGAANVASGGSSSSSSSTTTTTSSRTVAMPWTTFQATSDPTVYTTTVQRERIYSAPVYDYTRVQEYSRPEYIQQVYGYYGVQPAVGVNIGIGGGAHAAVIQHKLVLQPQHLLLRERQHHQQRLRALHPPQVFHRAWQRLRKRVCRHRPRRVLRQA